MNVGMKTGAYFILAVFIIISSCNYSRNISRGANRTVLLVLPNTDSSSIGFVPAVIVQRSAFNGVLPYATARRTRQRWFTVLLYTQIKDQYECFAGYSNFEDNIFSNLYLALRERVTYARWPSDSTQKIDLQIDSASITTTLRRFTQIAMGWQRFQCYCTPPVIALKVNYNYSIDGKVVKSGISSRQRNLNDTIYCTTQVPYSAINQEYEQLSCYKPSPYFMIGKALDYSYFYFNLLLEEIAVDIVSQLKQFQQ